MICDLNNQIVEDFKWYYDRGYITSRDGNAAYKMDNGYVVTASGATKNNLLVNDFCYIGPDGKHVADIFYYKKPSIETAAHLSLLSQSGKTVSVHVHSPNTVALAALFERGAPASSFAPRESHLLNTMTTRWPELFRYTKVGHIVPFLDPGSKKLHDCIYASMIYWELKQNGFDSGGDPKLEETKLIKDICIMQRHGVIALGDSLEECKEHIVRLEHVSRILLKIVTASGNLESIL